MSKRYERMKSNVHTYTGRLVDPLDMHPEDIDVDDIAHALANQCRFQGHTSSFYSVAQHSVIVSKVVPPEFAWDGLFHDAAEAYLQDMAKPLKNHPTLGQAYRGAEVRIERVIGDALDVQFPFPEPVKEADIVVLVTEARDLMHGTKSWTYYHDIVPLKTTIAAWSPRRAKREFLARYEKLKEARA